MKEYFKDWTTFEKCWLFIFTLINIYLFFSWDDTVIGLTASLTGMACVILVAKGKVSNYYFGIINVILYSYIAYKSKYYGEVSLNLLYFLPMQFVGIYYWMTNKKGKSVAIHKLSSLAKVSWMSASCVGVVFYWLFLRAIGGNLPFADSISTVLSVFAMILMVRRVSEQWLLWIAVDIVSIYLWLSVFLKEGNDVSMLVMWSAYLVNAIYGYYNWKKMEATP
jgi:nicotinamide mononucleotide transporter